MAVYPFERMAKPVLHTDCAMFSFGVEVKAIHTRVLGRSAAEKTPSNKKTSTTMSAADELFDAELQAMEQAEIELNKRNAESAGLLDADETENHEEGPNKSRRKVKKWLTHFSMALFTCAGQCLLVINANSHLLYTPKPTAHDACSAKVPKTRGDTNVTLLHAWHKAPASFCNAAAPAPYTPRFLLHPPQALRHRSHHPSKRALPEYGLHYLAPALARPASARSSNQRQFPLRPGPTKFNL